MNSTNETAPVSDEKKQYKQTLIVKFDMTFAGLLDLARLLDKVGLLHNG